MMNILKCDALNMRTYSWDMLEGDQTTFIVEILRKLMMRKIF
jgi:hypothetical protein